MGFLVPAIAFASVSTSSSIANACDTAIVKNLVESYVGQSLGLRN